MEEDCVWPQRLLTKGQEEEEECHHHYTLPCIVETFSSLSLPSTPLSERRRYCVARRHAVTRVCVSVCPQTARRISLGGEGNALYPVIYSFLFYLFGCFSFLIF